MLESSSDGVREFIEDGFPISLSKVSSMYQVQLTRTTILIVLLEYLFDGCIISIVMFSPRYSVQNEFEAFIHLFCPE